MSGHMSLETVAPLSDDPIVKLPAMAHDSPANPACDHVGFAVVAPPTGPDRVL
jgi:hypothetical protein